jgi:hypothetical protein
LGGRAAGADGVDMLNALFISRLSAPCSLFVPVFAMIRKKTPQKISARRDPSHDAKGAKRVAGAAPPAAKRHAGVLRPHSAYCNKRK